MKYQFIPDKEILLSNENDLLKTKNYATILKKIINGTINNEVFTIGLFGGWGSGKSSIVKTVKDELEENDKIKFIIYDAWKYSNDSFRRMFLLKVQEELKIEQTPEMMRFYQSETADTEIKEKVSYSNLKRLLFVVLIAIFIIAFLPIELQWKTPIYSILSVVSVLLATWNGIFHKFKLSISKPMMFAPEQFEDCFKQMVDISLSKQSWIKRNVQRLMDFVKRGEVTKTNLDKLVIVIDNIDRCHNTMAYELLTDIKTFLSNEQYNIVFVIPVDDDALKKHLINTTGKNSDDCNRDSEEFLRKFFNITIRIKPHRPTEMLEFVHRLNENRGLNLSNDTLSLISKEFAKNPRRVIQLLNNLSAELALYPLPFQEKNEHLICALLILKEEFFELYKLAIDNTDAIKQYNIIDDDNKKDQNKFMSIAQRIFTNANNSELIKILTNSDEAFPEIPIEIKDSINSYDINAVLDYIDENNKNFLGRFIVSRMQIELKHYASTTVANWIEFIVTLNREVNFNDSILIDLNNLLMTHYAKIVISTTQFELLCELSLVFRRVGYTSLKMQIFEYVRKISNDNDDQKNLFNKWFEAFIAIFKDEEDCKEVAMFSERYYKDQFVNQKIEYSDSQLKFLFNQNVVNTSISNIENFEKSDYYNEILWLLKNKYLIEKGIYPMLFEKIDSLLGEMRAKPKEDILSCIEFLTPLLRNINNIGEAKDAFSAIYSKLFNTRGIPHPSYTSRINYDTQTKFINEAIEDKDYLNQIIDFCIYTYRVSRGEIEIKEELLAMRDTQLSLINLKLIELMNNTKLTLHPLYTFILMDENYDNENSMMLISNCFKHRNTTDNKLYLSEVQIKNKIESLVDNVIDSSSVANLILELSQDLEIKEYVINDLTRRSSEFINSLPKQLLDLAISAFDKNTKDNFRDNYVYLGVIADGGTASQRNELVNLLCDKINECIDIESRLAIFEKLPKLSNSAKNGSIVSGLQNFLEDNKNEETYELARTINTIIGKFS